jgi:wyosine [tRNA(Phe)-imidazoG37] synthetase (radical SAM superfamily)
MDKKNCDTIPLQQGIIYGPVNSRRLGRSLGINLLPTTIKVCTFNCAYCQYGWTRQTLPEPDLPQLSEVISALEKSVQNLPVAPAYLTFSGNGEATLHPSFAAIVEEVIFLRNRCLPNAKTAILSNSSTVSSPVIREVLSKLDVRIMKLDCGLENCFRTYNRPRNGIELKMIVSGLKELQDVTIQTLFAGGPGGNFTEGNLEGWIKTLEEIKPIFVQIYTLDRGYPSRKISPLKPDDLMWIKDRLKKHRITSGVYF